MKKKLSIDFRKEKELDPSVWNIAVGEKWANKEAQQYTDLKENIFFNEEGLVLQATMRDDIIRSARIHTKDKFYFQYGKGEIVAKVPGGKGTWPALWMMPQFSEYGRWPRSGEIDIMEHTGNQKDLLYLCIHTEKYNHIRKDQYFYTVQKDNVVDQFHTYGFEWTHNTITYYIDGVKEHTYVKGEEGKDPSPQGWPFDQPFYLIMNLAIGGTLGGKIDMNMFPQQFVIQSINIEEQ